MIDTQDNFFDFLSEREANYVQTIMDELQDVSWAAPLLRQIRENGGLTRCNMALFFELRFGYALHRQDVAPAYEFAGEGQSTLDFGFRFGNRDWRVELMRLEETQAVREATQSYEDKDRTTWFSRTLSTNAADRRQSGEGETLKAVQRICQKCESNGQSHKFPPPQGTYQVLLVDFRTFSQGGDVHDRVHIGLGAEFVREEMCRHYWEGVPISGVFNERTTVRGAQFIRERVHFLGFVNETKFVDGAFANATQFVANRHLLGGAAQAKAALDCWPLQPASLLAIQA